MIDITKLKIGDSVFWLDSDNDIIEHTYIGNVGEVVILSGKLSEKGINENGFPIGGSPLIDRNIGDKIVEIAKQNNTYNPFLVCFAKLENLYETKDEASAV